MDDRRDRNPAGPHLVQNAKQPELVSDVEVRGGLIDEKNVRLLRQSSGESGELAFARRESPQAARSELFDARSHQGGSGRHGGPRR